MDMGYMIWQETCGSGVMMDGMITIKERQQTGECGRMQLMIAIGCYVVVRASVMLIFVALPPATEMRQVFVLSMLAFVLLWREKILK
jgi:hypothetical protein